MLTKLQKYPHASCSVCSCSASFLQKTLREKVLQQLQQLQHRDTWDLYPMGLSNTAGLVWVLVKAVTLQSNTSG